MLSLPQSLTKKAEAQPEVTPVWHPNFRNFERLPDTKVVRTAFFFNTAAVVVAACLLLWNGYREFKIYSIGKQIADAEQQIRTNSKANAEALRVSKAFAEEQKKIEAASAFVESPFTPSDFAMALGRALPKEITVEMISMRPGDPTAPTIVMRGMIAGSPDQAAGIANGFLGALRTHPRFGTAFELIDFANLVKDARTGFLSFDLVMHYKVSGKERK